MNKIVKKFHEWNLNRKQKKVNSDYEFEGLTDEILDRQIEINIKRHELDIPDKYADCDDEGFVQ